METIIIFALLLSVLVLCIELGALLACCVKAVSRCFCWHVWLTEPPEDHIPGTGWVQRCRKCAKQRIL